MVRVPPLADSLGSDVIGRWPLVSFLELGAPRSPGAVEVGLDASAETIELLVSELVTNAVLITRAVAADGALVKPEVGSQQTGRRTGSANLT